MRHQDRAHFVSLLLAAASWGVATVLSKGILASLPPVTLLVAQLSGSIVVLWTLVIVGGRWERPDRDTWRLALTGLLNPGLANTFGLLGLALTTASMATLLWAVEPVLILALANDRCITLTTESLVLGQQLGDDRIVGQALMGLCRAALRNRDERHLETLSAQLVLLAGRTGGEMLHELRV